MRTIITIILIIYATILLLIGLFSRRKIQNIDDYVVGGRKLPWVLIAASIAANDIGSGASLGIMQSAAIHGGLSSVWYIWLMVPAYLIGMIVAPKMRKTEVKTISSYFGIRYGKIVQIIAGLFLIIPNIGVIAINLTASASIIKLILGFSFTQSLLLSLIITSLYSNLGGVIADVYNDTVQLIILLFGFCCAALYIYYNKHFSINLQLNCSFDTFSFCKGISIVLVYVSNFIMGVATSNRIYSSKTSKDIVKSILGVLPLYFIYGIVPVYLGNYLFLNTHQEYNSIFLMLKVLGNNVPQFIFVFIVLGIIAASLSTVDTLLIGCSTILFYDILNLQMKKKNNQLLLLRLFVLVFILSGAFVAIIGIDDVISFLIFLLSLQASALAVPFVCGHWFDKSISEKQCLLCIAFSSFTYLFMTFLNFEYLFFTPFLISVILGGLVYLFISCINRSKVIQ